MDLSALVNDAPRPAAAAEEWGASTARSMHHSFDADERFRSSSDEEQLKPVRPGSQAEASAALAAGCIRTPGLAGCFAGQSFPMPAAAEVARDDPFTHPAALVAPQPCKVVAAAAAATPNDWRWQPALEAASQSGLAQPSQPSHFARPTPVRTHHVSVSLMPQLQSAGDLAGAAQLQQQPLAVTPAAALQLTTMGASAAAATENTWGAAQIIAFMEQLEVSGRDFERLGQGMKERGVERRDARQTRNFYNRMIRKLKSCFDLSEVEHINPQGRTAPAIESNTELRHLQRFWLVCKESPDNIDPDMFPKAAVKELQVKLRELPAAADGRLAGAWKIAWDERSHMAYWYAADGTTKWIDNPDLVTKEGYLLGGHEWLGQAVCRWYPAHGFAYGEILCWQPPTPGGDAPLWRMRHDDGDEEDLDEAEALLAMKLAKKMNAMPGKWVTLGAAVEVNWAADKRWYAAEVVAVTEDDVTVVYPPDHATGWEMTKDVIAQIDALPTRLRPKKLSGKAGKQAAAKAKAKGTGKTGLERKGAAAVKAQQVAAKRSVATRTLPTAQPKQLSTQAQQIKDLLGQAPPKRKAKQPRAAKSRASTPVDASAAFAPLNNDLLREMLSHLDPRSLAFGARVCRRLRSSCNDDSLWAPILERSWHWGSIHDALKASGTSPSTAALYSVTHRQLAVGTRLVLRYPQDVATSDLAAAKPRAARVTEPWLLGVVHGSVSGCFLLDWPSYTEEEGSIIGYANQPMDLKRERMRLRLSFPPSAPEEAAAGAEEAAVDGAADPNADIEDSEVLTEEQVDALTVGMQIRVWEGQWDVGIIRARDVAAHRVTLLGDGDGDGDHTGYEIAQGSQEDVDAEEESINDQHTTDPVAAQQPVVAAVSTAVAVAALGGSELSTCGRLLDLGLFASRGKLRYAGTVRPSGGPSAWLPVQRQQQLAQFELGDMVWATLKPYPAWPAVISCNPKTAAWRRADHYNQVVFFSDYTHRVMDVKDLVPFDRVTLQTYSNAGWLASAAGRRQRADAINTALRFWLPMENMELQMEKKALQKALQMQSA